MVIVSIAGGLGNQMFQYAAGRALAARLNTQLKLDTSYYFNNPRCQRPYELGLFCISTPVATLLESWAFTHLARPRIARLTWPLRKCGLPLEVTVLFDVEDGFNPRWESVTGNIYLNGMWQSERYFSASSEIIRQDFSFRSAPDSVNQAMMDQIHSTEAVSLHVRRGDKVNESRVGVCGLDYYHQAIEKLLERVPKPHFFVFSDDPAWAQENIKMDYPAVYVTHNTGRQDSEDLRLMSHCKHFIIANSTFSWWGAWLSKNPTKCVIAPQHFFADPTIPMAGRIPDHWVQL